jgi:pyruvate,water dikinase
LDNDGRRSGDYGELSIRALNEDLPTVLSLLRGYLDREDPRQAIERAAQRREALAQRLESGMEPAARPRFRTLLARAGRFVPIKESRNGVMCISHGALRMPALAAGRKLVAAGILQDVDDVFFLHFDEIAGATPADKDRLRALIVERRKDLEYWRDVVPPAVIGETAELPADEGGTIKGVGASKGVARGTARVIMKLEDAGRLQPGEVLVARTTTSAWTPLFLTAAAVITDSGGMLSHCAVVAREYELPAVVATYSATHKIRDGALVTVDGTAGVVTIEPA